MAHPPGVRVAQFGWKPKGTATTAATSKRATRADKAEVLTAEDEAAAEGLFFECHSAELEQMWLPMHSGCKQCHGHVFRCADDVAKQFGVCGCVVAMEMELAARDDAQGTLTLEQLRSGCAFPIHSTNSLAEMVEPRKITQPPVAAPKRLKAADFGRMHRSRRHDRPHAPIKQRRAATRGFTGAKMGGGRW